MKHVKCPRCGKDRPKKDIYTCTAVPYEGELNAVQIRLCYWCLGGRGIEFRQNVNRDSHIHVPGDAENIKFEPHHEEGMVTLKWEIPKDLKNDPRQVQSPNPPGNDHRTLR